MSKIWKRLVAYLIDLLIITMLSQGLASTTVLNPNINKYQKYNKEYNEKYITYANFTIQLQKYYQDNKLTDEEYNKLIEKYPTYENNLKKYYQENKLTKKNYKKLIKVVTKNYAKEANDIYYKIEKTSTPEFIIYLVLTFLYFVGFNYITNGQTLGKKIMKLKIVNINHEQSKVSIINYIIRTIPMYQTLYYIIRLIGIYTLNKQMYLDITSKAYYIQTILEFLIITCMIIRIDGRGLHDILAKTRVAMYNREGKEITKYKKVEKENIE